jgi:flagellar hook-associated protein 3 FlgL
MSGSVSNSTYGALARILAASDNLQSQINTLTQQTSTGLISQNYAGISQSAGQALSLQDLSERNTTYAAVITQAQGKAAAQQTAITQISTLVSTMQAKALTEVGTDQGTISAVAQEATQAFNQIVSLLNTSYGGAYIFSGADASNAPIPDSSTATTSTTGMFAQIGAQVQAMTDGTTPVATAISNTVAIASSTTAGTTLFSSYLTTAAPAGGLGATANQIQISDTQTVALGMTANQNAGATSDPSINGTGSAINDILRSLAVLANSTTATASSAGFSTLMQNVADTLSSAGATLTNEGSAIGATQQTLTAATNTNSAMETVIKTQLSPLVNVDMATAISKLQAVNTQLQTSYQVLALARSLNLASLI